MGTARPTRLITIGMIESFGALDGALTRVMNMYG